MKTLNARVAMLAAYLVLPAPVLAGEPAPIEASAGEAAPLEAPALGSTETVQHTYTCLGRQDDLDVACRRLRWEPGAPTPEGYRFRHRPRVAPLAIGSEMFGGAYLTRLATTEPHIDLLDAFGNNADHLRWHYLPIVGPWAVIAADAQHGTLRPSYIRLNVLDGALQGVGAALMVWGFTDRQKMWVKDKPKVDVTPKPGGAQITLEGTF
ncbi:MAG: hypothetical protein EA397_17700 [Deltaproteobacteria bacterium]|nr:MAG: hypothetical protein EA397_17700 [Deltaproteobacteria bacterium]